MNKAAEVNIYGYMLMRWVPMLVAVLWLLTVVLPASPRVQPLEVESSLEGQFAPVDAERETWVYKRIGFTELHLDLYRPDAARDLPSVVVYVHGGGWRGGSKRDAERWRSAPVVEKLLADGHVVAAIDYRLAGGAVTLEDQIGDVRDALRFLSRHAEELGIQPRGYAFWGASAGGHLVLMAASGYASEEVPGLEGCMVSRVLAWYPATDLKRMLRENPDTESRRLAVIGPADIDGVDRWDLLSPLSHADSYDVPLLLVHGDQDRILTIRQSESLIKAVEKHGGEGALITVKGGVHGFQAAPNKGLLSPSFEEIVERSGRFLSASCLTFLPTRGWQRLEAMPSGRSGMIAFTTTEGEIAYYGGTAWRASERQVFADGYYLSAEGWQSLEPLAVPIAYAPHGQGDGGFLALGGVDATGRSQRIIDTRGNLRREDFGPSRQRMPAYAPGVRLADALYSFGGSVEMGLPVPSAAVLRLQNGAVRRVSEYPGGPVLNSAASAWGPEIYVFGGGKPTGSGSLINSRDVWVYDVGKDEWLQMPDLPEAVRGAVAVAVPGYGIFLVGGYSGEGDESRFSSAVWLFEPDTRTFRRWAELPRGLLLPAVVQSADWLYVWGGEDAPQSRSAEVYRISLNDL